MVPCTTHAMYTSACDQCIYGQRGQCAISGGYRQTGSRGATVWIGRREVELELFQLLSFY